MLGLSPLTRLCAFVALAGLGCQSCSSQRASRKETAIMAIDPAAFNGIKLNTREDSACTPRFDDAFRGLVIAAPDTVDLSAPWHESVGSNRPRPVLPVCGALRFSAATGARFLSISDQVLLVAVNAQTHVPFVSNLVQKDVIPDVEPRPTPEQLNAWKNRVETAFFNANAFYYLDDLPAAPARYHLFAMVGDIISDLHTVEVVGQGSEEAGRKVAPGEAIFGKGARPPLVAPEFRGVRIQARVPAWSKGGGAVWIDGVAQLAGDVAAGLGVTPIQKGLVVTVASGFAHRSWNISGERALFVDDQERQGNLVRGGFGMDVSEAFGPSHGEGVYVMVSLGASLSNVIYIPPA